MATSKNTASALKSSAADLVRFTLGANEIAAADAFREAKDGEVSAALGFYRAVIVRHDVDLAALKPVAKGERRSNEAQAAFDFVRRAYAVYKCGSACAAALFDANVKGAAVLQRAGLNAYGVPFKPQDKRSMVQTIFGSKDWGAFVKRMEMLASDGEDADGARGASTRKTDKEYILDRVTAVISRLNRDVEKHDGSVPVDVAPKLAKALGDTLASFGIK